MKKYFLILRHVFLLIIPYYFTKKFFENNSEFYFSTTRIYIQKILSVFVFKKKIKRACLKIIKFLIKYNTSRKFVLWGSYLLPTGAYYLIESTRIGQKIKTSYFAASEEPKNHTCINIKKTARLFSSQPTSLDHYVKNTKKVDIIVPVYNAFEFLDPLFKSIFKNTRSAYNLIVINDASTDPRILPYLEKLSKKEHITLLSNKNNLGFPGTVNRALKMAKNDVVILNTDVELPSYWLERLMYPIYNFKNIASVTPTASSSPLTGFPEKGSNKLFDNKRVELIDDVFKLQNLDKKSYIESPIGNGFCMAINKKALGKVGFFNEKIFKKGYGEENDWCLRALSLGYKNLIASNLFCFHNRMSSFSSKEREELINKHSKYIRKKYPHFKESIRKFHKNTSYESVRTFLFLLLCNKFSKKTVLYFNHTLGGGSSFAEKDYCKEHKKNNLIIKIEPSPLGYNIYLYYKAYFKSFSIENLEDINHLSNLIKIDEIIINQLVNYYDFRSTLDAIKDIKHKFNASLIMKIRDFYPICSTTVLINNKGNFCYAEKNIDTCNNCIKNNKFARPVKDNAHLDLSIWRNTWISFFNEVDEFHVFSKFTKDTFLKVYKDYVPRNKIKVLDIKLDYLRKVKIPHNPGKKINIGILGNIGEHKGANILYEIDKLISSEKKYKNIRLTIFGKNHGILKKNNYMGEYEREDLPYLMEKHEINLIFIPSIWGETFCRTAEEAMLMDIPLAVFNLGAPAERVKKYKKGLIISKMDARTSLDEILCFYKWVESFISKNRG